MNIIVFSPYYPPHTGGLESHADEFNKYLSQKGIDITVFTPRLPKEAMENEVKFNNVKIIRFPAFEIISNYPLPKFWSLKFWKLFFALFKIRYDIAISRTRFFNISLLSLIYAKIKRAKWIHIEHGSDFVKLNSRLKSKISMLYDYTFGKLVLMSADKVVANSNASAEFCKKIAPKISCDLIYRGVETDKIQSAQPNVKMKNSCSNDVIITFIGRLIDGKGVADLIRAAEGIGENFKLFIIGEGPQKENLKKLSKKSKIEDKIIFFGHKEFEEVIGILKISDIFVNPSYTEGLPTSVIEAALCKKAIIATNVGGTPEIITDQKSGFLVDPGNINQLKEKLEVLINDGTLRETLGENAYNEVKDKFSWNRSIDKYLSIFAQILNSKF